MTSILALYPHLSPSKKPAQNIRADLKKNFPNTKFSVISDYNSVNISYEDGASIEAVESLVSKFSAGSFNGMEDIFEFKKSDFTNAFAGVKYVFVNRSYSDAVVQKAIDASNEFNDTENVVEDYRMGRLNGTEYTDVVNFLHTYGE